MKSMIDEVLEIIEGVAIIMKEGGAQEAVDIATAVQRTQTWMTILLLLASVKVIITSFTSVLNLSFVLKYSENLIRS